MEEKKYLWKEIELTSEEIEKQLSNKTTRMYVEILSEHLKQPKEEVLKRLIHAKKDYNIPVKYYANHRLYEQDDEESLLRHREEMKRTFQCNVNRISEITGKTVEDTLNYCNQMYQKHHLTTKAILDGELYKRTEEEIVQLLILEKEAKEARIKRIMDVANQSSYWVKKHMAKCKSIYGIAMGNYESTRCYELSDEELSTYANLEDSRYLGKKYIRVDDAVLTNKVLFNQTYQEFLGRKFWVNRDTSFDEFREFIANQEEVFLKPVDLHGGIGAKKLKVDSNLKRMYEELMNQPKLLLEEVIEQHEEMAAFNPNCVNTIRVFTICYQGEFHAFAAFIRFGVDGVTDNISTGGIGCGVDEVTGEIITPAMGTDGKLYKNHPITGKSFLGFKIPYWNQILDVTKKALQKVEGVDYVGWDIALSKDGVVIVEGNCVPCLSIYQSFFAYRKEGRKYKYERFM